MPVLEKKQGCKTRHFSNYGGSYFFCYPFRLFDLQWPLGCESGEADGWMLFKIAMFCSTPSIQLPPHLLPFAAACAGEAWLAKCHPTDAVGWPLRYGKPGHSLGSRSNKTKAKKNIMQIIYITCLRRRTQHGYSLIYWHIAWSCTDAWVWSLEANPRKWWRRPNYRNLEWRK